MEIRFYLYRTLGLVLFLTHISTLITRLINGSEDEDHPYYYHGYLLLINNLNALGILLREKDTWEESCENCLDYLRILCENLGFS